MSGVEELAQLALFEDCSEDELDPVLKALRGLREVPRGAILCSEGEKADAWWIVLEGTADVTADGLYIATIGPGETIGELALLDGEERAATVRAATDMVLEEVDGHAFVDVVLSQPRLALSLLRQTAQRLRQANKPRGERHRAPLAARTSAPGRGPAAGAMPIDFDPHAREYRDDPYAQLAALRATKPVHWSQLMQAYMVLSYADVHRLIHDRSLTGSIATDTDFLRTADPGEAEIDSMADKTMILREGEDHLRLRRLFTKAFSPKTIRSWQEQTQSIVDEMLERAAELQHIDVISDYALPLPSTVLSQMMGVPSDEMGELHEWSHLLVSNLDPLTSLERREAAGRAATAMFDYVRDLIAFKRSNPGDDLLTTLLQVEDGGERLGEEEVQAQVVLLYIAGHETAVNLIGNGVLHLLEAPAQLDVLRSAPELDANAVEELLRFDSPTQFTKRMTTAPMELGGVSIDEGSCLVLGLASANRDPDKWGPSCDVVDVARPGAHDHVSFGSGPHFCLGAALARMESQIAVTRLIRRFPTMRTDTATPMWGPNVFLRGLERLPVQLVTN